MRKVAAAALAVPVIALLYVSVLVRRSILVRVGLALAVGTVLGIAVIGLGRPVGTTATPPSQLVPLTDASFTSDLRVRQDLHAPISITFSMPMDRASVAAHITVAPVIPITLGWGASDTVLTVRPLGAWEVGTLHTITIEAGALAATGRPLSNPVRAAFLTRPAVHGTIVATDTSGGAATAATRFVVSFDGPVDPATVAGSLRIVPAVDGTFERVGHLGGNSWAFVPATPLVAGTHYAVSLAGTVRDADGLPLAGPVALDATTAAAPGVVRFRPRNGTTGVDRGAAVSVRFTQPMDEASTRGAFSVTANGTPVGGTIAFAEHDTVLVFTPTTPFAAGATVVATVTQSETSAQGVALAKAATGTFAIAKPAPAPAPRPTPRPSSGGSGGGSVGSGSWTAVEAYYLKLMNCTRQGGLVTSSGACSSPGGRNVAALWIDSGISSKVSRPYAKYLATHNECSHFIGGTPGDRLRHAGYSSYIWAENLGCRSGNPYSAVLGSHLYFQSERSYNGGHYVNLMNAKYDRVGIGVWVYASRVRLVIDFYHPL